MQFACQVLLLVNLFFVVIKMVVQDYKAGSKVRNHIETFLVFVTVLALFYGAGALSEIVKIFLAYPPEISVFMK